MSQAEKSTWIYAVVAIVVPAVTSSPCWGKIASTPVENIDYIGAMLPWPLASALGRRSSRTSLSGCSPVRAEKEG